MAGGRLWTKEEDEYILENAGKVSSKRMAFNLDRTKVAVDCRMYRLGVSDIRVATGMISANQLSGIVQVDSKTVYQWIDEYGLKATHKRIRDKGRYFLIEPTDFWKWAEQNKKRINFSKIAPKALLPEPDWFEEQRKKDYYDIPRRRRAAWSKQEDAKLMDLFNLNYSIREIAADLGRSEHAIQRKISKLRTVGKLPKRCIQIRWTDHEIAMMLEYESQGLSDKEIAYELGRETDHIVQKRMLMRKHGQYQGYKNR